MSRRPLVKQEGSGDGGVEGWGTWHILSIKEHFLNMDSTIFSLTSAGSCYSGGGAQTGAGS